MPTTKRTYGNIFYRKTTNDWVIDAAEPHVCIKLKSIFTKIPKHKVVPFVIPFSSESSTDLLWFTNRYPLTISKTDADIMQQQDKLFKQDINEMEAIMLPKYQPKTANVKPACELRDYQLRGRDLWLKTKRLLCGDEIGLGKTTIAILGWLESKTVPGLAVVQTHLPPQWKAKIEEFTDLRVHIIQGTKPYNLPEADVYIIKYSCLAGWVNVLTTGFFKSVVYDECQELRRLGSARYEAAASVSKACEYSMGLSHSPIYNYGDEIWNVLDAIKPGCLGPFEPFAQEWMGSPYRRSVLDPDALGAYLRSNFLMLRRTRKEVGRELPPVNKMVETVPYDEKEVSNTEKLSEILAIRALTGSFTERGSAARELDMLIRKTTGVSKAKYVASYVRMLLEAGEPVVLAGWHRKVYDIWLKELKEFNPVLYTGSESGPQKEKAKQAFVNGETNLFIISLRSGIGLDGLQQRCNTIVIGELDWSPKVHEQLIGRLDREGQKNPPVTAIYLVSNYGSDEFIISLLGLKSSQSHGIMDPFELPGMQHNDESRIKKLARDYLTKKGIPIPAENKQLEMGEDTSLQKCGTCDKLYDATKEGYYSEQQEKHFCGYCDTIVNQFEI